MKNLVILLLVISIVGFLAGLFLKNSTEVGLCLISEPSCINSMTRAGNSLFYGMGALALVFLVLLFSPRAVSAWKKFAMWFVPLATLLFIFYPEPGSGDLFSPYPEQVFQWTSLLYVIVSLIIIFYKRAGGENSQHLG